MSKMNNIDELTSKHASQRTGAPDEIRHYAKLVRARKEHRCDECGRLIPVGKKYWSYFIEWEKDERTHTNCLDFEKEPLMPLGFNQNRKAKP